MSSVDKAVPTLAARLFIVPVVGYRRFTRLRTTAEPTARLTTKPTFGSAYSGTGPAASSRCPDRVTPPARRPERIARLNSSGLLIRDCCGSTTPPAKADTADNLTRPAPPAAKPHREVRGGVPAGDIEGPRHQAGDLRSPAPAGPRPAISLSARNQTASWSRPLRRRAARTARPARVRIRSRKPCTFARRRLFGWNVRLLTGTPGSSGNCPQSRADMSCAARSEHGSAC